jgi:hypothetical protein
LLSVGPIMLSVGPIKDSRKDLSTPTKTKPTI